MASAQLRTLYRTARKHNVGCIVGESALSAWRTARILRQWAALEDMGAVRLQAEWDDTSEPGDYNPDSEAFGVVGEHRTDFADPDWDQRDVDNEDIPWHHADSVWGCVGYEDVLDWRENEYVIGIMSATIDAFRDAWKAHVRARRDRQAGLCTACHGTGRGTVA